MINNHIYNISIIQETRYISGLYTPLVPKINVSAQNINL